MKTRIRVLPLLGLFACLPAAADNAPKVQAKDVVLAPLIAPVAQAQGMQIGQMPPTYDGMAVSVLVETADGMLRPRATDAPFRTGERFRLKLLSPRDGEVLVYNTTPNGVTNPNPIWRTTVRAGLETLSERMELAGNRGEDQLHIVLQPQTPQPQGSFAWFNDMFSSRPIGKSKDVRLVTQNTPQGTYFYNTSGQGGYATVRIRHQ